MLYRFTIVAVCLALSGCGLPRGAGFQSEVLAASAAQAGTDKQYDFAVYEMTRDVLPMVQQWPANRTQTFPWLNRQQRPTSLIIAPGDRIQMTIWDAEENSVFAGAVERATPLQEVQVGPDGRIFVPYIGELQVSGMTPPTARTRIEDEMMRTIPSAQVQMVVTPGRANTANLVSGVAAPGVYPLPDQNYKLLDLLAQAGGANPALINPQVRLMRGDSIYGMSLRRLFAEPRLDTTLRGGDRVIVQQDERYFLSLGATGTESLHYFPKDTISALDAMAIIGGLSDGRANPKGILVLREYAPGQVRNDGSGPPRERVVFILDLTKADGLFSAGQFAVQPNDLVYATESPFGSALSVLNVASSVSSLSN
ncbi:polysaccharide biosynthesis/export family protein [Yoonia sp.]|uniref:polysaccharide biosynthesis/export family protein n=1 Tax=Yoonia sp. TaxID=2212373 RepID=UPI0019F8B6C7|nr:polysaccharide biosynthesis/export family protein [Yoonia sp.]MBE0413667.1 polysaccharide export protein [Yoonia sp.]